MVLILEGVNGAKMELCKWLEDSPFTAMYGKAAVDFAKHLSYELRSGSLKIREDAEKEIRKIVSVQRGDEGLTILTDDGMIFHYDHSMHLSRYAGLTEAIEKWNVEKETLEGRVRLVIPT